MNPKDESLYYLTRILSKGKLDDKRKRDWFQQLYKHQCVFIHITKTAGVSVSVSLLGKGIGNMSALYHRILFGKENFDNFFKFTFVRNPFTRLVSAYEYVKEGGSGQAADTKIVQVVKAHKSLEDFVLNYLTPAIAKSSRYFKPQYQFICDSDNNILTDFLGRFENIAQDYEYIRNKIGTGEPLQKLNVTKTKRLPIEQYYTSDALVEKVISLYKKDFEMLGYSTALSAIV